jgi:acetamidase/formamidase
VSLRFTLHKSQLLAGPLLESAKMQSNDDHGSWLVVESATDGIEAARRATDRMIDLLVARWSMQPVHAYLLCSVAMKLQLSQVVNEPMITVAAAIPKNVLPQRALF